MIHDGTSGIFLNYGIRVRDQVKFPSAPDIKAVLAEMHEEGGSLLSLLFDVSKAHRRVPVLPEEWGRQACQVVGTAAETARRVRSVWRGNDKEGMSPPPLKRTDFSAKELAEDVFINKVGPLGVASAGYWWGRVGAAVIRLGHYFVGFEDAV